jgi:hypothetical protein
MIRRVLHLVVRLDTKRDDARPKVKKEVVILGEISSGRQVFRARHCLRESVSSLQAPYASTTVINDGVKYTYD